MASIRADGDNAADDATRRGRTSFS